MSGSRTRDFYSGRRVPRRSQDSVPGASFSLYRSDDPSPYQPRETLMENPSRRHVNIPGVENENFDEESQFCLSSPGISRSPLTTTTVHNVQQPPGPLNQNGIVAMLQQQQELLQKVLQQQEEMQAQQTMFSQKIARLEDEIRSSSCSSSPSLKRGKNRVTRDLTVSVCVSLPVSSVMPPIFRIRLLLFMKALKMVLNYLKGIQ